MRNTILISTLLLALSAMAQQQDTTLNRNVTVERDFQPVVQQAGKITLRPEFKEATIAPATIHYSDYTPVLFPSFNPNPLLSQPTRFSQPKASNGMVRLAFGHVNTLFDAAYRLDDGKKSILDVYAHHRAEWGIRTNERTTLGLRFTHPFSTADLYFGVEGGNHFYTRYGRYFDADKAKLINPATGGKMEFRALTDADKTSIWKANAFVGLKSNNKSEVQYYAEVGYALYAQALAVAEHQIRTKAGFEWSQEQHSVGANVLVQNSFLQVNDSLHVGDSLYNSRHGIRIEPYYAYKGDRFLIHLGMNLDLNIGRGQLLSNLENVSFAPSPNVHFEAQIAKKWLTLYGDVTGSLSQGTVEAFVEGNRFRNIVAGIVSHHAAPYTPVDAELGLHIRPYRDLLIELHGGYAYLKNQSSLLATLDGNRQYQTADGALYTMLPGMFSYIYSDYGRGKVGGQVSYHYRDIVNVHLSGDYFIWQTLKHEATYYSYDSIAFDPNKVYDRAKWQIGLRIDGRIDRHWSLYSDNHFAGSRLAMTTDGEKTLRPIVNLNLGCQYEMYLGKGMKNTENRWKKPNFAAFFQLNNYIHRHNDIYYGYQSEGINFLLGAAYKF